MAARGIQSLKYVHLAQGHLEERTLASSIHLLCARQREPLISRMYTDGMQTVLEISVISVILG